MEQIPSSQICYEDDDDDNNNSGPVHLLTHILWIRIVIAFKPVDIP